MKLLRYGAQGIIFCVFLMAGCCNGSNSLNEADELSVLVMVGDSLINVSDKAQEIALEIKTNRNITCQISPDAQLWISPKNVTRAISSQVVCFNIERNRKEKEREGLIKITIDEGEASLDYRVYQKAGNDYLDAGEHVEYSGDPKELEVLVGQNKYNIQECLAFISSSKFRPIFRIPTICITNAGTSLVACENRTVLGDNSQEIDILVSRETMGEEQWDIRRIVEYNAETYGRSMNPSFTVDRVGAHGPKGRIYLFYCHFKASVVLGYDASTDEVDMVYKYSDDDGVTWSEEQSIKTEWNLSSYRSMIPSPGNGIQLEDGTLIVPTMAITEGYYRSGLCFKRVGQPWHFSCPTPNLGDDESTVFIDNEGNIKVDCRTRDLVRRQYTYNMDTNTYQLTSTRPVSINMKMEVTSIKRDKHEIYLGGYLDTQNNTRENLSLFGSQDGIEWKAISSFRKGSLVGGYSNAAYYDGKLVMVGENVYEGMIVRDYTPAIDEIITSVENNRN